VGETDTDCINMESIDSDLLWTQKTKNLYLLSYETSVGERGICTDLFSGNTETTNTTISSVSPY
jgi:hypothetical protein